ncbi:hypothetical protein B0H16DRAFT_1628993 [Mycena metata]|uniref:DUF6924 domain-containing protein n=1 Tax=Mycena metata TaxID=1033252 RepID=A0AAD7H3X1_9AGAR|nr:hypothetical protein B0H16DRAFT_1628993 [Mycena metata]
MSRPVPLYTTSSEVSDGLIEELQTTFHSAPSSPPPGLIQRVPNSDWAIGRSPTDVLKRHREDHVREFSTKPLVIMDDQTARDKTVLLVEPRLGEDGAPLQPIEARSLRFEPSKVSVTAMNLKISNQSIEELEYHVDPDGIWREFK